MKKTLPFIAFFLIVGWNAHGQKFVKVTQSDLQHQITLTQDQALEVRLPSTPSTGFGWYPANNNKVLQQVGNWEFISDNSTNTEGVSGTQISHFVSVASGTTELEFIYKRPWEDASNATDSYKVTVVSEGAYTGKKVEPYTPVVTQSSVMEKTETTRALPAAFSWKAECTSVKDQKSCGSCWSFASSGAFEAVINIWDKKIVDNAEQWLVNCDQSSSGCSGGTFAFQMLINNGCVYEADEPYKAANGTCKSSYTYHEKAKNSGTVSNNLASIKQALYDHGPMYVSICAGSNFQNYKSGILTQTDGTSNNHAVLLCGWDDNGGGTNGYWIIRNSWGGSWGESGYIRAQYGVSGLGQKVGWVDYKGILPHNTTNISDLGINSAVQVFPNPSSGTFKFDGLENENTIQIYDFVGNMVYQTTSKNSSARVDLKEKSQGIYIYKVINTSTQGVKTGKLIVY